MWAFFYLLLLGKSQHDCVMLVRPWLVYESPTIPMKPIQKSNFQDEFWIKNIPWFIRLYWMLFFRSPFQAHTFVFVYAQWYSAFNLSAIYRRSISNFQLLHVDQTRRRLRTRRQNLGPLGLTSWALPTELDGPHRYIKLEKPCKDALYVWS